MIPKIINGAVYFAQTLKEYGISHVFLVPALMRKGLMEMERLGIKRIITHSEKAAAYMADGFARASLKPSVCMAQSVGAAYLAAGLQDAYLSCSPVIAITGRKPLSFQHRHSYQEVDHEPFFEAVTKYNVFAADPATVPDHLRQCFREATVGRPGPTHIDITNHTGINFEDFTSPFDTSVDKRFTAIPAIRIPPASDDINTLSECFHNASKPVLVVGNGASISGASEEIITLANRFGIPVMASVDGKSLVPDDNPLYMGPVGEYGRKCANTLIAEADFTLFAGCNLNDQLTRGWSIPARGSVIAQIDICAEELGRNYPCKAIVWADAKLALQALIKKLETAKYRTSQAWSNRASRLLEEWQKENLDLESFESHDPMFPQTLCGKLSAHLPKNAVVVTDTGFSAVWAAVYLQLKDGKQRLIRPGGGSLGWGYPASLGVKLALPDKPVVCFTGDGAFWYHLAEMETAMRHNIKTVTIINNNGGLGQTSGKDLTVYKGHEGKPEELYQFRDTDFAVLARQFGCKGITVNKAEELDSAFQEAFAADSAVIINVRTDINCDPQKLQLQ